MPRTAGPPQSDSARFTGLQARVANAQAGRGVVGRFRQMRRGNAQDWSDVNADGLDVAVHEYEGPLGRGYDVECWTADGWHRVSTFGPETWREREWHLTPQEMP